MSSVPDLSFAAQNAVTLNNSAVAGNQSAQMSPPLPPGEQQKASGDGGISTDKIVLIGLSGTLAAGAASLISYGIHKAVTRNAKSKKPDSAAKIADSSARRFEAPVAATNGSTSSMNETVFSQQTRRSSNDEPTPLGNGNSTHRSHAATPSTDAVRRGVRLDADEPASLAEDVEDLHEWITELEHMPPAQLADKIREYASSTPSPLELKTLQIGVFMATDLNVPPIVHQALNQAWIELRSGHSWQTGDQDEFRNPLVELQAYRNCRTDAQRLELLEKLLRAADTTTSQQSESTLEADLNRILQSVVVERFYLPRLHDPQMRENQSTAFREAGLIIR